MAEADAPAEFADTASIAERFAALEQSLSPTERKVAKYLCDNPSHAIYLSAQKIAEQTQTSDATVVRTARTLGYAGLSELKQRLGRELSDRTHPAKRLEQRLLAVQQDSEHDFLAQVGLDAMERVELTLGSVSSETYLGVIEAIAESRCVFTFGTGISASAAEYAAKRISRLGHASRYIAGMGFSLADELMQLRSGDCVIIFCPGRLFREIEVILDLAERIGVRTILVTHGLPEEVSSRMDIVVHVAGSPGGLTGEMLASLIFIDAVLLGLGALNRTKSTEASKLLNELRRLIATREGGQKRYR